MRTCSSAVGVAEGEKTLCRAGEVQSEGAEQLPSENPPGGRARQVPGPKKGIIERQNLKFGVFLS